MSTPPRPEDHHPLPSPARLRALLAGLEAGLLQRGTAVRLALLAALAGEHVLLIGPPGTAKSALARRLHAAFAEVRWFERLLTRFSTPEELFGPLSLKALEEDRYERLTDGFLPTAGIAFLDEVFKANSAILNALLTLLNEREFDNGAGRQRTPLVAVVAASNEVPSDEALHAFFDRFLLRVPVAPVDDAAFAELLALPATAAAWDAGPLPSALAQPATGGVAALTQAERQAIGRAAAQVGLGDDVLQACRQLRDWLTAQQITVSDRRWRQFIGLMRTAAATEGRATLDLVDLWPAPYVAAATPEQAGPLGDWVQHQLLGATAHDAPWLTRAVQAFEAQLTLEQSARQDDQADDAAGKLALARSIGLGTGDAASGGGGGDGMLRIVSQALEAHLQRRFSPVHIAARVAQVDELLAQAVAQHAAAEHQAAAWAERLAARVWLPVALSGRWLAAFDHTRAVLAALVVRLTAVRAGFATLPVEDQAPAQVPEPVVLEPWDG